MADQNQMPQNSIPPRDVPPAPAKPGGATAPLSDDPAAGTPRTVRLKPFTPPGTVPSVVPGLSPADAVKKATSRIPLAGVGAAPSQPPGMRRTAPIQTSAGEGEATVKRTTSRIPMPGATAPIPAVSEAPKTIKIRPLSGTQPVTGTQPVPYSADGAPAQAAKTKTSRIPLEAAMGIPQTAESATPKTIKLKRPGEMSTVKVTVPGAAAASEDAGSVTQKKTIRVKRPTVPAAAGAVAAEGAAPADAGPGAPTLFAAPTVQAAAGPERGAGPFVAVAALAVLAIIALIVVLSSQSFGPKAKVYLNGSDGPEITLPGAVNVGGG
jgi:hypothetical protein